MSNQRNTYVVENLGFSSNKWRVLDASNGFQVEAMLPYSDLPDETRPPLMKPLCGNTKAEATAQILRVAWKLSKLAERQAAQLKELRELLRQAREFIGEHGYEWDGVSSRCVACDAHLGHACEPDCDRMLLVKQADDLLGGGS